MTYHRLKIQKHTKPKKISPKKIFFLGLFLLLIAELAYFILFWPGWQIKEIKISFEQYSMLKQEDILLVVNQALSKNIFICSVSDIKASLIKAFPQIKEIEIKKIISPEFVQQNKGSFLEIRILERKSEAIWCQANASSTASVLQIKQCFYLDKQGVVYQQAPIMEGRLVLSIYDFRAVDIELGKQIISQQMTDFILEIKEKLPRILNSLESSDGLGISYLEINSLQELIVHTSEKWQIYMTLQQSADKQLEILKRALNDQIKQSRKSIKYIDLRIENRAYYQ